MSSSPLVLARLNKNQNQGALFAIPASCTILGLIFFHVAAFGCKTFKAEYGSVFGASVSTKIGYWKVESPYDNGCLSYGGDNSDLEGVWRFGRFIGVFGALIIWVVFALVMMASCFRYPRPELVFTGIGGCMLVLSLFSFLLLVGLSADKETLSLAGGGALAILSAFLWFGAAVSIVFVMKERARPQQPHGTTAAAPKPSIAEEPTSQGDDTE